MPCLDPGYGFSQTRQVSCQNGRIEFSRKWRCSKRRAPTHLQVNLRLKGAMEEQSLELSRLRARLVTGSDENKDGDQVRSP